MTAFTSFTGTNPPVDQLPVDFKTAVRNSQTGRQTLEDDRVIGSALAASGYCAQDKYKQQLYCACVNAPVANPECIFAPCANQSDAYKSTQMQRVENDAQKECPTVVNCTQIFDMGGADNIASNVTQSLNCGVIETFVTSIQAHPLLAVVLFVMMLVSVGLLSAGLGRRPTKKAPGLPPPDLVMPGVL
jgi:hypothetical protein